MGGTAAAHVEEGEGGGGGATPNKEKKSWVVFCPNVIPGELVRVRVYRNFASYSNANLLHIIKPKRGLHQTGVPPGNRVRGGDASTSTSCLNGRGT